MDLLCLIFFSLHTFSIGYIFAQDAYIFFSAELFSIAFFYQVYKSNQTGILQSSDIIFCTYSTMY